jgi:ABC-type transporter Mla MlaB component
MLQRGELSLLHVDEVYDPTGPIDPEIQLTGYAAQTNQALSHGYTGLRAAADATTLVADPAKREAHVRWESVADRYMASHPLAALCAYDQNAVPNDLLSDLQCVHPASHNGERRLPFRLSYLAADTLALEGEVDTFSTEDLERMLRIILAESDLTALDLKALDFIDHRGLMTLINYTQEHPVPLVNMPAIARRLCELLKLTVYEA